MTAYRRVRIDGGCYFFTVAIADRSSKLLTQHIEMFYTALEQIKTRHPFVINAMVVLPDHLHCIWTLPDGDCNYSLRWQQLKGLFSRQLPKLEVVSESRKRKSERGIWQRRFWEHTIRDEADYINHINYIYFNPVKHGWVNAVKNWPYSTFHNDVQTGLYDINWGCDYQDLIVIEGE